MTVELVVVVVSVFVVVVVVSVVGGGAGVGWFVTVGVLEVVGVRGWGVVV